MEIPLNARVECSDAVGGRSVYVLINPVVDEVTHLVVRQDSAPHTEYIVPVEKVMDTIADAIQLRCSKAELEQMAPFVKTRYIEKEVPASDYTYSGMYRNSYYLPYILPMMTVSVPVPDLQISPGELAVNRGTHVEATDGYVGKVDEFVVNPENCHITHLVMREGHLWGQKEVIIPLSAIDKAYEETVYLKINKQQIEALPSFPLRRRWT
jgi:sporulation protein YlmC with PRC-barrel domain